MPGITYPDNLYDNKVIQEYLSEVFFTRVNNESRVNIDRTLTSRPGEEIVIYRYEGTGSAEEVVEGSGNKYFSDIVGRNYSYAVKTVQDRTKYTDEEVGRNPLAVDYKLNVVAAHLVNFLQKDIYDQWLETTQTIAYSGGAATPSLAEFMSAFGKLDVGLDGGYNGTEETVACHMSSDMWLSFQNKLQSNVLVEYDLVNGQMVPRINGRQIIISDLLIDWCKDYVKRLKADLDKGHAIDPATWTQTSADVDDDDVEALIQAAKEVIVYETDNAVRLLTGKCVATESDRIPNKRLTVNYARQNYVAALEFNNKACTSGVAAFEAALAALPVLEAPLPAESVYDGE